jgi:histidinol-phosphate/aromatic aminotransferase/cobyric acid decarboxylase-like protein
VDSFLRGFTRRQVGRVASLRALRCRSTTSSGCARCRTPLDARRAINNGIRENTFEFLDKKNVKFIPSQTNFFIMEVGRPALTFAKAMAKQKVFIVGPSGRRGRLKFG